jgi:DNA-binding NtrC family response regulator
MGNDVPQLTPPLTVAVASRDRVYRDSLSAPLRRRGFGVRTLDLTTPLGPVELDDIDVLVVDTDALTSTDLEIIAGLQTRFPLVEVVEVTGSLPVEEAVDALRSGVFTVLQHPVADDLLVETIAQAGRRHLRARARLEELNHTRYTVGSDADRTQTRLGNDRSEEAP